MPLKKTKTLTLFPFAFALVFFHINIWIAQAEDMPNPKVNYVAKINELSKAGRSETLNAAPYYEKAIELYVEQPEQLKRLDHKIWPTDVSPKERTLLKEWVQSNSNALKQLELGTKQSYYWLKRSSPNKTAMGILVPELSTLRKLTYAVTWRAKMTAAEDKFDKAIADIATCYRFGMHTSGPKTLVEQLVGIVIRAKTVQTAFMILDRTKLDPSSIKSLQNQIDQSATDESYIPDLQVEKYFMLDWIQRIFTDDGKGGGYIPKAEIENVINMYDTLEALPPKDHQEQIRKWKKLERQQTTQLTNKLYEYCNRAIRSTPWQLHNEGKDLATVSEEMTKENPLLSMLLPNLGRVSEVSFRCKAKTDALVTTLALLQYNADKNQFPTTLQELVSTGYLKSLPIDPYSDKPLVYKREKDNFTIYSLGANFDDDGGVPSKWGQGEQGGDKVFWPVQ